MGWTFHYKHNSPRNHAEEKAEIEKLFTYSTESGVAASVLQASKVGSVWYVAIKLSPLVEGKALPESLENPYIKAADGSVTFGAVILTKRSEGGWGYKDMSECMGPNESSAPASLLAKLSTLQADKGGEYDGSRYARQWRERCKVTAETKRKALKLKEGDSIRLESHLEYTFGTEKISVNRFEVTSYFRRGKNRRVYRPVDYPAFLCRIPPRYLVGATLIKD